MTRPADTMAIDTGDEKPEQRSRFGRYRAWRNRMVADARFQALAARIPPLRWVARRQANRLFNLTAGFVHAQVLHACVTLDLFAVLAPGPRTTDTIATAARLPVDSAARLLEAAEALGLFCRDRQGRWWLDDLGAVVAGNPGIRAMVRHHSMLYRDLADPAALLREPDRPTETNRFWAYAGSGGVDDETAAAYSELMAASQDLIAAEALGSYEFSRHRTVLDIGGGTGAFLRAVGAAHPGVALWLFDLPNVAELAADGFARDGWADRTRCAGGDFFSDPMPEGADCLTLVRVLCDHDDGPALRLLKNIHSGMRPSDTLLIAEPMAGRDADGAALAAYFGMYFLAMRSGHCRTPAAITALLGEAGFGTVERRRTRMPLFASVIVARN